MKIKFLFIFFITSFCCFSASAQVIRENMGDERAMYAETKQVNQFFRRFNNEESPAGDRYYEKRDSLYRDPKTRLKYLDMLFNNQNKNLNQELKNNFIKDVTDKTKPVYLDFHGGNWFAEVDARFIWNGREHPLTMFMSLEKEKLGTKWIITKVSFEPFLNMFREDTTNANQFLHPMSHEIDFMNLNKVFRNSKNIEKFAYQGFQPDQLTMFLYEVKKGNLKFNSIASVKFHFFQINNWYFEVSEHNRGGYNSGWLISNLVRVNEKDRETLKKYILREK